MNLKMNNERDFYNKSPMSAMKEIQAAKDIFIANSNNLTSLGFLNREGFRGVYNNERLGIKSKMQVILSPMYNNNGGLSTDKDYFNKDLNGLERRIKSKVKSSVEIIEFMRGYFSFDINYIIADSGMLLNDNLDEIDGKVNESLYLFKDYISELINSDDFNIGKMSDFDTGIERIRDMNKQYSINDCISLINNKGLGIKSLLKGLPILLNAYGPTITYYELDAYFKESKFIGDNYKNNIIVNIEGTSVGNNPLVKGKDNMCIKKEKTGGNLLVGGVLSKF